VEVVGFELAETIFPLKLAQRLLIDQAFAASVNAPESCERFELSQLAEWLAQLFDAGLLLRREKEYVP